MYNKFRDGLYVGLDEAGRGSCIGPLAVSLVAVDDEGLKQLKEIGVKDSKKLTSRARLNLFPHVLLASRYVAIKMIQPHEIDRYNISTLTIKAMCSLVKPLTSKALIKRVVIDYVNPLRRLERFMRGVLEPKVEVLVVKDADDRYVECMAASILAKVARDNEMCKLKYKYGVRGSGYPSDLETIEWLRSVASRGTIPPCVRRSWATISKITAGGKLYQWL
ncbi:MAG: ribonuclease HII [Candidatus Nezhaarchaeota archaeon]|nr:ribonuclease HII [Candidatus Nezhaarchaeota archaeon]MCX8141449.1 ribonuclease HII [Candidatus Nezhaarchaeota archaeon]MDW8049715.1 ribonuclease HII [Nitrososphaerota archaeon]